MDALLQFNAPCKLDKLYAKSSRYFQNRTSDALLLYNIKNSIHDQLVYHEKDASL